MEEIQFITGQPAMIVEEYIILADIHLGITLDFYKRGVNFPSQLKTLVDKINNLKRLTKAKKLVILGDLKNKITGIAHKEWSEIPAFLESLKFDKIVIVKGNHDGNIEKLIQPCLRKKVSVRKSFSLGNCYFTHGHRNDNTKKPVIIIGHSQPHVEFRDRMRAYYTQPVWIRGKIKGGQELIIMPAFNPLSGATIINRERLLGPIAKKLSPQAHAFLLDGTDLGTIADLRRMIRDSV